MTDRTNDGKEELNKDTDENRDWGRDTNSNGGMDSDSDGNWLWDAHSYINRYIIIDTDGIGDMDRDTMVMKTQIYIMIGM